MSLGRKVVYLACGLCSNKILLEAELKHGM